MRSTVKKLALVPPLQRLKAQRDQLLVASISQRTDWTKHRPYTTLSVDPAISIGTTVDDHTMVARLVKAYRGLPADQYGSNSMWREFFATHHKKHHDTFLSGDVIAAREVLANPAENNMFYGFDELCAEVLPKFQTNKTTVAHGCKDNLLRLAEAIGAMRVEAAEGGVWLATAQTPTDDVIEAIEEELGVELSFPDIYAGAVGDRSRRGIITYRAVHAVYLAFRARQILRSMRVPAQSARICEIGAGLGRSALHAHQLGMRNYTLVDVPMTLVSQGYYLMRCLGEDAVTLPGEAWRGSGIRLMTPDEFLRSEDRFDLVLNVDSLTEVGDALAAKYVSRISELAREFLSINHECNHVRVKALLDRVGRPGVTARHPYWMRHGYVEERVLFSDSP